LTSRRRCHGLMRRFSSNYWTFFLSAFCMDLGFGLFVFLFNLYLTDLHFDERIIGRILACFTLGNVAGTVPAMIAARRYGLRSVLLFTFGMVPVVSACRLLFLREPEQLALAFLTGAALCGWPICFSPAIAQLTREDNRAAGFSMAFGAGIALGTLAGIAGGYLPEVLHTSALHLRLIDGIRVVLFLACAVVALGLWPLSRFSLARYASPQGVRTRIFHPYLFRFLPAFVLWNIVTGSFPLFGAVYLQNALGIPLGRLGAVFAASQLTQFVAVLGAPLLFRRVGIAGGVSLAQLGTAALLVSIAGTRYMPAAVCFYVLYFAAQFMCGPGIYQMLMEQIPEAERSSASALQNLSGALCQAGTAAITGACIVAYGYRTLLIANAVMAVLASSLFAWLGFQTQKSGTGSDASERAATSPQELRHEAEWMAQKAAE
jgi:MFS family permease